MNSLPQPNKSRLTGSRWLALRASFFRTLQGLALVTLLSACKVDLYSGLDEKQGNEMLALLLAEGIDVEKKVDKGNTVKLAVDENQLSNAIEILSRNSYPRDKFASLNDVFPQGGLISSPTEESARYTYAMSQDLAATVSNIDGVLTARVHLVLPSEEKQKSKLGNEPKVAKASVFIKHSSNVSLDSYIPQIKLMVANSVENLKYENVAVVIFPSVTTFNPIAQTSKDQNINTLRQLSSTLFNFKGLALFLLVILAGIFLAYRYKAQLSSLANVTQAKEKFIKKRSA